MAVSPLIQGYLVDLAQRTRHDRRVQLGVSPRGLLTWQRLAQAWALLQGRPFVIPDDVQDVARPALEVRLGAPPQLFPALVEELLQTPVPLTPA